MNYSALCRNRPGRGKQQDFMSPPLKGSPSGCQEVIQSPKQQIPGSCLKSRETNKSPWIVFQHDFKMRRGNYLAEAFNAPRSCLQTLMTCCYVWLRCICCSYFTATHISRQSDKAAQAAGLTGTPNESAERGESAPAQTRYRPNMTSAARRSERSNVSMRFAFKSHARMQSRMPSQQVCNRF